jgi:hypothetical protein
VVISGIRLDPKFGETFRKTDVRMNCVFHLIRQIKYFYILQFFIFNDTYPESISM